MRPEFASGASGPPLPLMQRNPMNSKALHQCIRCIRSFQTNDISARAHTHAHARARTHTLHILLLDALDALMQRLIGQSLTLHQVIGSADATRCKRGRRASRRLAARVLLGHTPCGCAEARPFPRGVRFRFGSRRRRFQPVSPISRGVKLSLDLLRAVATWRAAPQLHADAIGAAPGRGTLPSWGSPL
jgi:hypothetical protein